MLLCTLMTSSRVTTYIHYKAQCTGSARVRFFGFLDLVRPMNDKRKKSLDCLLKMLYNKKKYIFVDLEFLRY